MNQSTFFKKTTSSKKVEYATFVYVGDVVNTMLDIKHSEKDRKQHKIEQTPQVEEEPCPAL